jgi:hypothetical protein
MKASIGTLETQMAQLVMNRTDNNQGRLPSQSEKNPQENVSSIILRNGREIPDTVETRNQPRGSNLSEHEPDTHLPDDKPNSAADDNNKTADPGAVEQTRDPRANMEQPRHSRGKEIPQATSSKKNSDKEYDEHGNYKGKIIKMFGERVVIPPPFPQRFAQQKKEDKEKEIFNILRKVEINIPLLDAIKQILRYAKFLKELCTKKMKLGLNAKILVNENVFAIIQQKLPQKCKDPSMYVILIIIGAKKIQTDLLDLRASINVMPLSTYKELNLPPLKDT